MYAQQMASWLDAAEPLKHSIDLQQHCSVTLRDVHRQGDMVMRYSTAQEFQRMAHDLAPMMTDVKVSSTNSNSGSTWLMAVFRAACGTHRVESNELLFAQLS